MEPSSPTNDLNVIEGQLREAYGRVVWTHKTHEKAADIANRKAELVKIMQIAFSAVITSSLIVSLFGKGRLAAVLGTVLSAVLLGINLYLKNFNLGKSAQQHTETAHKLWNIRESYLSLLVDMKLGSLDVGDIRLKRDQLQEHLSKVYETAPRTNDKSYKKASRALKSLEELTFSDEEIDRFLPKLLRKDTKE